MYYITDTASSYTSAWLLIVGIALIVLVLFFPKGIMGTLRKKWLGWLP
jgi:branched-chain amino acid transport system permease protein